MIGFIFPRLCEQGRRVTAACIHVSVCSCCVYYSSCLLCCLTFGWRSCKHVRTYQDCVSGSCWPRGFRRYLVSLVFELVRYVGGPDVSVELMYVGCGHLIDRYVSTSVLYHVSPPAFCSPGSSVIQVHLGSLCSVQNIPVTVVFIS